MPKIMMLKTIPGSMDGIHSKKFIANQEYEIDGNQINQRLADMFIKSNLAKPIRERKQPAPEETAVVVQPEIKTEDIMDLVENEDEQVDEELDDEDESVIDLEEIVKDSDKKVMRCFELAKELKMDYKVFANLVEKLNISAKPPQLGLTQSEVDRIKAELKKD